MEQKLAEKSEDFALKERGDPEMQEAPWELSHLLLPVSLPAAALRDQGTHIEHPFDNC